MYPESRIFKKDAVPNSKRKTNGAKVYYPVLVHEADGKNWGPALFSDSQILVAIQRAEQQPEDVPYMWKASKSLTKFQKFVAKLVGIPVE